MRQRSSLLIASLLCSASVASSAGPVTYFVTVNTSSISGTVGSFDINFNPGPLVTQAASLQILNFSSDGTLQGGPTLTGDVAGVLPATLTFDNGAGFNDYFRGFKFGSTLSFRIALFGPALSSPDGVSTSGTSFAFSMFSDAAGSVPALTGDPNGFALRVDVNLDGTTTPTDFSSQTSATTTTTTTTPIPTLSLPALIALAVLLAGLGGFAARRNTGGLPKTLALAVLLLLPLGFGAPWLRAQTQDHPGGASVTSVNGVTLLTRAEISTTASGLAYSRRSQTFSGTITITNISTRKITGPFHVVIDSAASPHSAGPAVGNDPAGSSSARRKPFGAVFANPTGNFGGIPYVTVPKLGSLTPGQSATVNVQFENPSNAAINITPVIYCGRID
jgi:hypothetical protein